MLSIFPLRCFASHFLQQRRSCEAKRSYYDEHERRLSINNVIPARHTDMNDMLIHTSVGDVEGEEAGGKGGSSTTTMAWPP